MSIVYFADPPMHIFPPAPIGAPVLVQATESVMVWSQTFILDGVPYAYDLTYAGSFRYADPLRPEFTASGTVTELTWVFDHKVVTFRWADFSTTLAEMDRADLTVGGWDAFYRNTLLPGDDLITASRNLAEHLWGYDGADTISTGPAADTLEGGAGRDQLRGGDGNDSVAGGDDGDDLNGNRGADTLDGGAGNDVVRGGKDDDRLSGGRGDDQLFGDLGSDTLTGGEGGDLFHLQLEDGRDLISDFNPAEGDRIQIDADVDVRAEQVGEDIRIILTGRAAGDPHATEILVLGADLGGMADGWLLP